MRGKRLKQVVVGATVTLLAAAAPNPAAAENPTVSVTSPADLATYEHGEVVVIDYACQSDGVAPLVDCTGYYIPPSGDQTPPPPGDPRRVPDGALLDTTSTGFHDFVVYAEDSDGAIALRTNQYFLQTSTASATVTPADGGSASTGSSADFGDPVATTVTVPAGTSGGAIAVTETAVMTTPPPASYQLIGRQVDISAPVATWDNPLQLVFVIDESALAGATAATLAIFRNGAALPDCLGATTALAPTGALPEGAPCVAERAALGDGDVRIMVLTPRASAWNFGVRLPHPCDAPTISGTARSELLLGTRGPDVIDGRGGHDLIDGAAGDDVICGGEGNDKVNGGPART